jgi:hypothetical protein
MDARIKSGHDEHGCVPDSNFKQPTFNPSLRAQRSNPFFLFAAKWIASLRSQ